jgi:hypothetical protein
VAPVVVCVREIDVRTDEQQWKHNIADAAGQPDRDKQNYENAGQHHKRQLSLRVHQDMERRSPGADENVAGVREFRPRPEKCDPNPEQGGGIDEIPFLDEAQMKPGADVRPASLRSRLRGVLMMLTLAGIACSLWILVVVKIRVGGDGDAQDVFAEEGQNAIAQSGDPDRAEITHEKNCQEIRLPLVKCEE